MHYLTACAIFKQENPWLKEWIDYHLDRGVEHFYLYNNDDHPNESNAILREYVEYGIVDNIPFPGPWMQGAAYHHAIETYRASSEWMAMIDLDEFLLPRETDDIRDVLDDYDSYSGLVVHWCVFGSSGHQNRPENQMDHFLRRAEDTDKLNMYVKSIIKPKRVMENQISSSHVFTYHHGFAVNEEFSKNCNATEEFTGNVIRMNHYCTRSYQDFVEVKSCRGIAAPAEARDLSFWNAYDRNEVYDNEISRRFGYYSDYHQFLSNRFDEI